MSITTTACTAAGQRRIAAPLATLLILSGCASPYVARESIPTSRDMRPVALADSIAAVRTKQGIYHDKVVELGGVERAYSNTLLGLGTLILGLAVGKVHSSAIEGTVLGAGAVYTFGTTNTDKRRAQIYIAGMKALDCAVDAVTPSALNDPQQRSLKEEGDRIDAAVQRVGDAIGDAETWSARARIVDAEKYKSSITSVGVAVAAGEAAVAKANDAKALAEQRTQKPHQLAEDLNGAASAIDRAVLDEIRGTENAIQAIPAILGGLQQNAALFSVQSLAPTLVAKTAADDPSTTKPRNGTMSTSVVGGLRADSIGTRDAETLDGITAALGRLRAATVALASAGDRLGRAATISPAATSAPSPKTCDVAPVDRNITAAPTTVTIPAKTASTQSILVDGGNGNYIAAFLQSPTAGLSISIPVRSIGVVNVVATDQTVMGSYPLLIEDTTRKSRQIVTVVVGTSTPSATVSTTTTMPGTTPQEQAAAKIKAARTLKLAGGGTAKVIDAVKRGAGVEVTYQVEAGATPAEADLQNAALAIEGVSAVLGDDPKVITVVAAAPAPHAGRLRSQQASGGGPVVGGLDTAEVEKIQSRLCMSAADGVWGPKSQGALAADRRMRLNGSVAVDEPLTLPEAKALLALADADAKARCKGISR